MSLTQLILDGPLAVLSLVRPGGNRISFEMRRELREAVRHVAEPLSDTCCFLLLATPDHAQTMTSPSTAQTVPATGAQRSVTKSTSRLTERPLSGVTCSSFHLCANRLTEAGTCPRSLTSCVSAVASPERRLRG